MSSDRALRALSESTFIDHPEAGSGEGASAGKALARRALLVPWRYGGGRFLPTSPMYIYVGPQNL